MVRRDGLTRALAVTGTVLCWLPVVITVLLSVGVSLERRVPLLDYLMPAELFPLALLGGLLLTGAAARARSRLRPIVVSLVLAVLLLVGGQAFAVASGLADGSTTPDGWQMGVVLASIALYVAALVSLCVHGTLLTRDLWRWSAPPF